ncbi:MAG: amino-acid N-acetyltransferase [Bordetella sp.]|nr:MAG: amino-acid N-acetyltransferase [Bordetella sp.]
MSNLELDNVSKIEVTELSSVQFVKFFREVAPCVNAFRGKIFVVAFEGELIQAGALNSLIHDLSLLLSLGIRLVLVHGSRPQINEQLLLKGLSQQFYHGFSNPTDSAALECAKEAAGEIRLDIEANFSQGLPNTPMSHSHIRVISGNFVTARPAGILNGIDFQHTGHVRKIDIEAINFIIEKDSSIVLLSPLGFSPTGDAFNLSMEELATFTAVSLCAEKLIFLSDSIEVHNSDGSVDTELTRADAEILIKNKSLDQKTNSFLKYAALAVKKGVSRAHLLPYLLDGSVLLEIFTHDGIGTMIVEDTLDDLRAATIDDVGAIIKLIEPFERDGTLIRRPRSLIERDVENFTVLEHDGIIYACAALYSFPKEKMAEMACLIVHPEWQNSGEGELLLRHMESRMRSSGIKQLFVLTARTSHWFLKRGFVKGTIRNLPKDRQNHYNHLRNSLILIKKL